MHIVIKPAIISPITTRSRPLNYIPSGALIKTNGAEAQVEPPHLSQQVPFA